MPLLELHHLIRKPAAGPAIAGVDLALDAGELMAIVGAAGSGKTRLLRMIAGLEPIDSGDVVLEGLSICGIAPRDRGVAMVASNFVLYPHLTVYGNIAFGLRLAKLPGPEIDRRAREAARLLELSGLLDRNPHGLTPGKRPLVAIGRAIARRPRVLLLDEPLGSLSGASREELQAELPRIHQRLGIAMVIATRHRDEAQQLCPRAMTLDAGRLV